MRRTAAWTAAEGVGAREWLEMGGEKNPRNMSELGCADGCGREMGAENCADGCGRRGCKEWLEMGGDRALSEDGCGRQMGAEKRTAGRRGCNCEEREMGAENCADGWVQRIGWKWVGGRSRW